MIDHTFEVVAISTARKKLYVKGKDNCVDIQQHSAQGEGDKWFYDVHLKNNLYLRIFDVIEAQLKPSELSF